MMQNLCFLVDSSIARKSLVTICLHRFSALSVRNDVLSLHLIEPLATMCGLDFDTMSAELRGLWPLVQ